MWQERLMKLWKEAFGDRDAFIRLFFNKVYRKENTLTVEKEGEIISALYMLPYSLSLYGKEVPICYVCGVMTVPSEQGKGHMRNLLQKAFLIMEQRGYILSVLIPAEEWLFDYYRGLGYREMFDYKEIRYFPVVRKTPGKSYTVLPISQTGLEKVYDWYNKMLHRLPVAVLHSYQDFLTIVEDLHLSSGELFVAYNRKEKIKGVAFCYPEQTTGRKEIRIKEFMTKNESAKEELLAFISSYYASDIIYYRKPATGTDRTRYGMIKIIDRIELINRWISAQPGKKELRPVVEKMEDAALLHTLFDYPGQSPYISLMMD